MSEKQALIGGPYFEDFEVGATMPEAPSVTVHYGHGILHQALFGDRLRLPLDNHLSKAVTGRDAPLANPALVCNIAIGQTTYATQRVKGNLFYRGLVLHRPVYFGDTLTTTTKVAALKQNRSKPGRPATGMVVLDMLTQNQDGDTVLHFWRAPMIACRDAEIDTGCDDSFDEFPDVINEQQIDAAVPNDWRLDVFKEKVSGAHFEDLDEGSEFRVEGRDTVTCAPELVRATLNMAYVHSDAIESVYSRRLVYGGHTISMAAAHVLRPLPNIVTFLGWRSCNHTGPVFEQDILRTEVKISGKRLVGEGGVVDLHVKVFAERGPESPEPGWDIEVLDWHVIALMA